jgi:molecular chaperone DnaJ
VHVVFDVADDPRFERDGEDLYTELLVTYPQLVLGATLDVPTVTVQRGAQIPAWHAERPALSPARAAASRESTRSGTGDLHVRVQLWTPEKLSPEEEQLIERLAKVQQSVPVDRGRDSGRR